MEYAIVVVPAAPVRRKAKHQSEMVNQLLFGDAVKVLKSKREIWYKVQSLYDLYEGWVTVHMLEPVAESQARQSNPYITIAPVSTIELGDTSMQVPAAASLPAFADGTGQIGRHIYHFKGQAALRSKEELTPELITDTAMAWLNAPYLWGGRTLMGIDCSGFVQIVFKVLGIDLPRDAWQQAQEGITVNKLKESIAGDLVFFDDRDEIVHVGILLAADKVIHASGRVRIDKIDKKGIIHSETGKRTHSLRVIKRCR